MRLWKRCDSRRRCHGPRTRAQLLAIDLSCEDSEHEGRRRSVGVKSQLMWDLMYDVHNEPITAHGEWGS